MKGSVIGDEVVIAAGSIISGEHKENNCVYGSKKRIIHRNIRWEY